MTRKDYVELAKIMNGLVKSTEAKTRESKAVDEAIDEMVEWLSVDNPKFDAVKFIEATYKA